MKYIVILSFILVLLPVSQAFAHRVIIFAWVEDGMIHTESSFGSKSWAQNCSITVVDEKNKVVRKGVTDRKGHYSFKIPEKIDSDLVLKLDAGPGHHAEWRLSKEELISTPSKKDIKKEMEKKEELEKAPSVYKIIGGIFIIFLLGLSAKFLKRKKS
ncbi:MAG: hypothetical protein GXP56_09010 [Deltaproteobacteria bacterium]|nr:hypothetical protein [Deltaproteobacteria bacterium]